MTPLLAFRLGLGATALALIAAACGPAAAPSPTAPPSPGPTTSAGPGATEISVLLSDSFTMDPPSMPVTAGTTVTFRLTNTGVLDHEFFVGDAAAQDEHEAEMQAGGMRHDDPNGVSVAAGTTKTFEYTFTTPGELIAGCHVSGHYAAGMKATITVSP